MFYDSAIVGFVLYCIYECRPGYLAGLGKFLATVGDNRMGSLSVGGGWPVDNPGRTDFLSRSTLVQPDLFGDSLGGDGPAVRGLNPNSGIYKLPQGGACW